MNCGRIGKLFCKNCQELIEPGIPLLQHLPTDPALDESAAIFIYNRPIKSLIRALKYQGVTAIAEILANLAFASFPDWTASIITWVPLHKSKLNQRGFNQAELITKHLSKSICIPYLSLLTRAQPTSPQAGLSRAERLEHYQAGTFLATPECANQNIILLDDVLTTGATLIACARALKAAGANSVYGLAIAHGS